MPTQQELEAYDAATIAYAMPEATEPSSTTPIVDPTNIAEITNHWQREMANLERVMSGQQQLATPTLTVPEPTTASGGLGLSSGEYAINYRDMPTWVGGTIPVPEPYSSPLRSPDSIRLSDDGRTTHTMNVDDSHKDVYPVFKKKKSEATLRRDEVIEAAKTLQALIGETYPYTHKKKEQLVLEQLFVALGRLDIT